MRKYTVNVLAKSNDELHVRSLDLRTAGAAALARARELDWEPIARNTLAAYGLAGGAAAPARSLLRA